MPLGPGCMLPSAPVNQFCPPKQSAIAASHLPKYALKRTSTICAQKKYRTNKQVHCRAVPRRGSVPLHYKTHRWVYSVRMRRKKRRVRRPPLTGVHRYCVIFQAVEACVLTEPATFCDLLATLLPNSHYHSYLLSPCCKC
jgi:hypothetical protein